MSAVNALKKHLKPGQVYRRADLLKWSNAVDRHIKQLLDDDVLVKVAQGVYACPKKTSFGKAAPEDSKLVKAFLGTDDFLLFSPNAYNSLGLGTTQLYNEQVVYNRKRHGRFKLGNRYFNFQRKPYFPKKLSREFLLVDLVSNVNKLAEDTSAVWSQALELASSMPSQAFKRAANTYGGVKARKFVEQLEAMSQAHAAA